MNCLDVIFFQAEVAPEKIAIVAQGSVIPYGRLAHGIVSAQARFAAAGVTQGQVVGINVVHPIDHFVIACALFRMKVASASMFAAPDRYVDAIRFDAVVANALIPSLSQRQPAAKIFLVDTSWFQDKVAFSVNERASATRDPGAWICRLLLTGDGGELISTSASSLEAQVLGYNLSAPPDWERMVTMLNPNSDGALLQGLSALYQGRTVIFADPPTARNLIAAYKHHLLVGELRDFGPILAQQKTHYLALTSLRAAYIEGWSFPLDTVNDCLALISSNTVLACRHPQVGTLAYGPAGRVKATPGGVGFVAPWMDVEVVGPDAQCVPDESDGRLRVRRRTDMQSLWRANAAGKTGLEWIDTGRRGRRLGNHMLVVN